MVHEWKVGVVRRKPLDGLRFGRLMVSGFAGRNKFRQATWFCSCDCGTQTVVSTNALRTGSIASCGCAREEAQNRQGGASRLYPHEFTIWKSMLARCENPKNAGYHNYGGRGIRVCERWHTFANFLSDMGEFATGMSIERNDVNGDYCPENCRWATRKEQSRNRQNTIYVTFLGRKKPLADWCEQLGIPYKKAAHLIRKRGLSAEVAFERLNS